MSEWPRPIHEHDAGNERFSVEALIDCDELVLHLVGTDRNPDVRSISCVGSQIKFARTELDAWVYLPAGAVAALHAACDDYLAEMPPAAVPVLDGRGLPLEAGDVVVTVAAGHLKERRIERIELDPNAPPRSFTVAEIGQVGVQRVYFEDGSWTDPGRCALVPPA